MSLRVRLLTGFGATALTLTLAACGSGTDGASAAKATDDAASQGSSQDCPDKHSATVEDSKFGGTAEIDLCALPEIHKTAVEAEWAAVHDRRTEYTSVLNVMPVTCDGDTADSCTEQKVGANDTCGGKPVKPNCHPGRGDEVSVVCSSKGINGDPNRWYGVLLDSKKVLALGTGHDTDFALDFSDKGDKPIGYVAEKDLAKASTELPACDGTMLHGSGARARAQAEGLPLDKG